MTQEVKYPHVLAAVRKHENGQWAIGDALLEDVGNGKLDGVVAELAAHGFEYSPDTLAVLRQTARKFPKEERHSRLCFAHHFEARTPKILAAAIAAADEKRAVLSKRFIRAYVAGLESEEHRSQRRAHEKAKAAKEDADAEREEARKAKQKAKDAAERERAARREREAEERAERAREKVRDTKPKPEKKTVCEPRTDPVAVTRLEFDSDLSTIVGLTRRMRKTISPIVDDLPKGWINGTVEELLEAAENLRKLADLIRKTQPNQRGHLTVVA